MAYKPKVEKIKKVTKAQVLKDGTLKFGEFKINQEMQQRLLSKWWRLHNFYKIKDKNAKLVTFQPNPAQKDFHQKKENRNIILKSRQLGFTTYAAINMADSVFWRPNIDTLLISYDEASQQKIFDGKIMLAWEHYLLKPLYSVDTERANKLKIGFPGLMDSTTFNPLDPETIHQSQEINSSMNPKNEKKPEQTQHNPLDPNQAPMQYSTIEVKNSGRSDTLNIVHISEFAKICAKYPQKAREIITGTFPAIPLDGELTIESTAEGDSGQYHDMFWEAWNRQLKHPDKPKKQTEFKAFFYNWRWDTPELSKVSTIIPVSEMDETKRFQDLAIRHKLTPKEITYYYLKYIELNKDFNLLHQEYPLTPEEAFVSSGNKLFDVDKLMVLSQKRGKKPLYTAGNWSIFEEYEEGHQYAVGADPSEGVGRDHSAATIIDFSPRQPRVVATFKSNKVSPDLFAHELKTGAMHYGAPLIAVERNNHGHATLVRLKEIYPVDLIYKQVRKEWEDDRETERLGWDTNTATKPRMFYDILTAINQDLVYVSDLDLYQEMKTYNREDLTLVQRKRDYDNYTTQHWDLLTSFAICYQMRSELDIVLSQPETYSVRKHTNDNKFSAI